MSAEVQVSPKALAVRFNGVFCPTERGHLAHELIRVHATLKKNADLKVLFSMTGEQVRVHELRKGELCRKLGLSTDEETREKTIQGFNGWLTRYGFPYYKIKI